MPNYDYKCLKCNNMFEMFQPMTADPIKTCPECDGDVKRLIGTGAGPIFKGSGFYQTDYKQKQASQSKSTTSSTVPTKKEGTDKKPTTNSAAK